MKRLVLFYPLILAAVPVIFLASRNANVVIIFHVIPILVAVLALTLLLTLFLRYFIKDSPKVAGIVSILLLVFFSYGHIYNLLGGRASHWFLLPIAAILGTAGIWAVLRYRGDLLVPMRFVAVAALALIILNLAIISPSEYKRLTTQLIEGVRWNVGNVGLFRSVLGNTTPQLVGAGVNNTTSRPALQAGQLPDIYFIILDMYARADVLNEVHGFDNSDFLDFLKSRGFYVASNSRSNYWDTGRSITSTLNMDYLDLDVDPISMIPNNKVMSLAKGMGIKIVQLYSGWEPTRVNPAADIQFSAITNWNILSRAFSDSFFASLVVSTVGKAFGLEHLFISGEARIFKYNMLKLREIAEMPEPTFTFLHSFPPHPPFIFDRNGREGRWGGFNLKGNSYSSDLYIDQLIYVNKKTAQVVDEILSRSPTQPVIIIQADHGSRFIPLPNPGERPSDLFVRDWFGNLNAIYLPEYCRGGFYPTMSSVNTFRLVFDQCLGTSFGLLEDKSFYGPDEVP